MSKISVAVLNCLRELENRLYKNTAKKREEKRLVVIEAKKIVSELIFKVLIGKLCVREAIELFPPDIKDSSIQCAWHALVHYEADQEYRIDPVYAQEQNDYLEMVAFLLRDNKDFPKNIIDNYDEYYEIALIKNSKTIYGWLRSLFRFTI